MTSSWFKHRTLEFSHQGRTLTSPWPLSVSEFLWSEGCLPESTAWLCFIIFGTSGFSHLTVWLCCSRLAAINLFPTSQWGVWLSCSFRCTCLGTLQPDPPGIQQYSLWLPIRLDHLAWEGKVGEEWGQGAYLLGFLTMGSPRSGCVPPLKTSDPVKQLPSQNSLSRYQLFLLPAPIQAWPGNSMSP